MDQARNRNDGHLRVRLGAGALAIAVGASFGGAGMAHADTKTDTHTTTGSAATAKKTGKHPTVAIKTHVVGSVSSTRPKQNPLANLASAASSEVKGFLSHTSAGTPKRTAATFSAAATPSATPTSGTDPIGALAAAVAGVVQSVGTKLAANSQTLAAAVAQVVAALPGANVVKTVTDLPPVTAAANTIVVTGSETVSQLAFMVTDAPLQVLDAITPAGTCGSTSCASIIQPKSLTPPVLYEPVNGYDELGICRSAAGCEVPPTVAAVQIPPVFVPQYAGFASLSTGDNPIIQIIEAGAAGAATLGTAAVIAYWIAVGATVAVGVAA